VNWFAELLAKYPELAVFLALAVGFWVGNLKIRGFSLGGTTGSLLAGIAIGLLFDVPVSGPAKSLVFLLFLFGIGYEVGPKFFSAMKGEGWRFAALAVFMPVVGLLTAWGVARQLGLDPGFAAGMLSGALTESPAMGTAAEADAGRRAARRPPRQPVWRPARRNESGSSPPRASKGSLAPSPLLIQQFPNLGQLFARRFLRSESLHHQCGRRSVEHTLEQIGDELPLRLAFGPGRFVHMRARSLVTADQALLVHDLQQFQDGRIGTLPTHLPRHLAHGARAARPQHLEDGEFGVGRLFAGACDHGRHCLRIPS
jgi:AspT/YidE/YbjL antiporter-like protein